VDGRDKAGHDENRVISVGSKVSEKDGCSFRPGSANPDHYAAFTARRYHSFMIKTYCNAVMAFVVLSLLDRYLCGGHYTGVAHAILRQIGHGLG